MLKKRRDDGGTCGQRGKAPFLEELSEGMHHAVWGGSRSKLQKCQSTQFLLRGSSILILQKMHSRILQCQLQSIFQLNRQNINL